MGAPWSYSIILNYEKSGLRTRGIKERVLFILFIMHTTHSLFLGFYTWALGYGITE